MPLFLADRWAVRGARRMNPPHPRTVPTWNLLPVLRALEGPPFELLQSSSLRVLSLKTALLLALASVKPIRRPAGPFRQHCLPGIRA